MNANIKYKYAKVDGRRKRVPIQGESDNVGRDANKGVGDESISPTTIQNHVSNTFEVNRMRLEFIDEEVSKISATIAEFDKSGTVTAYEPRPQVCGFTMSGSHHFSSPTEFRTPTTQDYVQLQSYARSLENGLGLCNQYSDVINELTDHISELMCEAQSIRMEMIREGFVD